MYLSSYSDEVMFFMKNLQKTEIMYLLIFLRDHLALKNNLQIIHSFHSQVCCKNIIICHSPTPFSKTCLLQHKRVD